MDLKRYCKTCDRRELPGDHNIDGVQVRPWLQGWTGSVAVAEKPVTVTKPRTKAVTKRDETPAAVKSFVTCAAPDCANPVKPSATGRPGRFCGPTCRKRASRRK